MEIGPVLHTVLQVSDIGRFIKIPIGMTPSLKNDVAPVPDRGPLVERVACRWIEINALLPEPRHPSLFLAHVAALRPHADALDALLSLEERARRDRFVHAVDRERFSLFRGAIRVLLARAIEAAPGALRIVTEARGKPILDPSIHGDGLHFSISHSGDYVALLLSRDGAAGVDLESVDRSVDAMGVARHSFHPRELERLRATPPADQPALFFRWWTAKEAVVKASGVGLSGGLSKLDFADWPRGPCFHRCDAAGARWFVWPYEEGRLVVASATRAPFCAIRVCSISGDGATSGAAITRSS